MEQHFEEFTNQFTEDVQICIIKLLSDISTRRKMRNENDSLIQESSSLQSLKANVVGQSSINENVANTVIPSHSNDEAVNLIGKHTDDVRGAGKGNS